MSSNIFARKKDIVIRFKIKEEPFRKIVFETEEMPLGEDALQMTFKYPNWHDDLFIRDRAMEIQNGVINLNASLTKYRRFCRLLVSWNLTNEEGESLEISEETFKEFDPEIIDSIIDKLDSFLSS